MTADDLADLLSAADHLGWMRWASCAEVDPELFFPEDSSAAQAARAKVVCRRCPVRGQCLEYALDTGQESGVWGGLGPRERRERQRRAA